MIVTFGVFGESAWCSALGALGVKKAWHGVTCKPSEARLHLPQRRHAKGCNHDVLPEEASTENRTKKLKPVH